MSRYLTPSKVALLALGSVYTEGVVPTSETTSILSFLISHLLLDASHPPIVPGVAASHAIPIEDFETALLGMASAIPGRTLWDLFLKKLWSLDCSGALDLFITNLPIALAKSREQIRKDRENGLEPELGHGKVSRTSPLGAFIRRAHLEYTRLQFHDAANLWQTFIEYRLPTRQAWEKKNATNARSSLDVNLSDFHIDASHPLAQIMYGRLVSEDDPDDGGFSVHDKERLMEFQVSELQRLGGRLPVDMKARLGKMSQSGVAMPNLAHYLRFLDSWRAGDYSSAFDNLHRYFDYTMQSKDRTFYQYALLNLAILQADFGCHSEAIPAMQEAISIARENKDITCLNFCMSWLYHFGKAFPAEMREIRDNGMLGSETDGLAFLKSKAKDAEMWSLLSTSLLSEAKMGLQNGESVATAYENIAKAAHLNMTKGVVIIGPTLIMRGSIYGRLGLAHLAWSNAETFLKCYSDDAPAEDVLKCSCRMASLLVQSGRYHESIEIMEKVPQQTLRVLKYHQYWMFCSGILKLRRHLHRNDIFAASNILVQLQGYRAPDIELGFMLSLLEVELLVRRGVYDQALDLVESLANNAQEENTDVLAQIKLLDIKARILAKCGHPLKGFSITVRAANMANRAKILPALWDSSCTLSNILICLKEFTAAVNVLEAIVPHVFECEDCDLAARTFSLLVDANMGLAGEAEQLSANREEFMNKALEYIDSAFQQFRHVEDLKGQCEMLAKKATVMHLRGDLVLANDCASQYLDLKKEYEASRS